MRVPEGHGYPGVAYRHPPRRSLLSPSFLVSRLVTALSVPPELVDGDDISQWQPVVDYPGLKLVDNREFLVVKATEHSRWVDPKFETHWKGGYEAGLIMMVYHFFRCNYSGYWQAVHFLETAAEFFETIPYKKVVWIDVETTDGSTLDQRRANFNSMAYNLHNAGWTVGGYSSKGFWDSNMLKNGKGPEVIYEPWFVFWPAHWTSGALNPPRDWVQERLIIWQKGISNVHSWCPETKVFDGPIDYDVAVIDDLAEWMQFDVPPPPPPPDAPPAQLSYLNERAPLGLNIRVRPDLGSEIAHTLLPGEVVWVVQAHRTFVHVITLDGFEGWCKAYYMNEHIE